MWTIGTGHFAFMFLFNDLNKLAKEVMHFHASVFLHKQVTDIQSHRGSQEPRVRSEACRWNEVALNTCVVFVCI